MLPYNLVSLLRLEQKNKFHTRGHWSFYFWPVTAIWEIYCIPRLFLSTTNPEIVLGGKTKLIMMIRLLVAVSLVHWWTFLFLLTSPAPILGNLEEDMRKCCALGKKWAKEQQNSCDNFPVPIDGVPVASQVK